MTHSCRTLRSVCLSLAIGALLAACAHRVPKAVGTGEQIPLRSDVFTPVTFIQHEDTAPMSTYLAQNVDARAVDQLRGDVEKAYDVRLKSRGEAHITVISPVEYDRALKKYLSMARISQIAREAMIQQIPFRPVCLGRGNFTVGDHTAYTFFIVVEAPALLELRKRIHDEYVKAGGDRKEFDADFYQPHITVGFTDRDLHYEDGVMKDASSCLRDFTLVAP